MPSPTTALDLITRAMKLAKLLSSGETPTAEEATDALATLNDILENWDTEPMALWGTSNFVGTTVGGQATYSIGPNGNFDTTRPAQINGAFTTFNGVDFQLDVVAQLVAESIASALERRVSFRRAMKQAIFRATKAGALGIKAQVAGRLGGAEIARTEWYNEGRLPLSTIRADIDYGFAEANTMYGVIGCKIWIYRDRENERPVAPRGGRRERSRG